ncbi:rhodanese-like domain-containing protein [Propionibacteriaceae bacterium G1746]|uniref:rhodanese-like domain-containing protein n=1 Tax=Aestuariimicrobium sp. G57 TaxID=3418485 RepID=UPI003C1F93F6
MSAREPGTPLVRNAAQLVAEANARIDTVPLDEARSLLEDPAWLFVDVRDPRELAKLGTVPGSFRAPRGMLEFWVDPESPYYRPALDDGRKLLLFCGSGWRSALAAAALRDMGRDDVAHLEGGFSAWTAAGLPTEEMH